MKYHGGHQRGTVGGNCDPPMVGHSDSGNPNPRLVARAWEEYFDRRTKLKYWYNTITQESTWDDPMVPAMKPPPPPSSPPPRFSPYL